MMPMWLSKRVLRRKNVCESCVENLSLLSHGKTYPKSVKQKAKRHVGDDHIARCILSECCQFRLFSRLTASNSSKIPRRECQHERSSRPTAKQAERPRPVIVTPSRSEVQMVQAFMSRKWTQSKWPGQACGPPPSVLQDLSTKKPTTQP